MCDTIIALPSATADGRIWFGKNSDREPGEAQAVEHMPRRDYATGARLQCTHIEIPQVARTHEIIISRPFWMWGAEMGTNEHGLTIGNEAVFTRLPYARTGLTGMDLLRLALERATTARAALELITGLIATHGQGGRCGYRNLKFRYHNSFVIADGKEAWALETADRYWVARRVYGVYTVSNVLAIGRDFDLIGPGTYEYARTMGWCDMAHDFDFAQAYGDPVYRRTTAGELRRARTREMLTANQGKIGMAEVMAALRDHAHAAPDRGWRNCRPCLHAAWHRNRRGGQTTGSMISRLDKDDRQHWLTGTSSPCLSVFLPMKTGAGIMDTGPAPGAGYDGESLFWRHERLHRLTLRDYARLRAVSENQRTALEAEILRTPINDAATCSVLWERRRTLTSEWTAEVEQAIAENPRTTGRRLFHAYWAEQMRLDQFPETLT
ncbi:MAG: C69 family dipeptidase [Blastocatellia bacterium]